MSQTIPRPPRPARGLHRRKSTRSNADCREFMGLFKKSPALTKILGTPLVGMLLHVHLLNWTNRGSPIGSLLPSVPRTVVYLFLKERSKDPCFHWQSHDGQVLPALQAAC